MQTVLIVEADLGRATALRRGLAAEGYEVIWARDADTGILLAAEGEVDLVVLGPAHVNGAAGDSPDWIKVAEGTAQIIVPVRAGANTGRNGESLVDVIAKVGAVLRERTEEPPPLEQCCFGDVEIDFTTYRATKGDEPLELSTREFEILRYLVERRGETVSREELLRSVWSSPGSSVTRTVDVHIAKLRKKIGDPPHQPRYILTVHRSGYKFVG